MNKKEKKEIAINLSILVDAIINKEMNEGQVANTAISFAVEILNKFPEIRELVEEFVNRDFDSYVAWVNFEKELLKPT